MAPVKAKTLTVKERLSAIQRILSSRKSLTENFNALKSVIPPGVDITDISTTESAITVKLASTSLESLNTFLEEKLATILDDKELKVKKIDVSGFGFQRGSGGYSTTVMFAFNK